MGEPYVADKPDTKQGLKNRELRWVTVNTYLTEHLAGKNYRESKSSEEVSTPSVSDNTCDLLSQVLHHLPQLFMCFSLYSRRQKILHLKFLRGKEIREL